MILFSGGKDSTLLVHLAVKAFAPAPVPFALLHVDTGHNYPEVIDFRDRLVGRLGLRLEVAARAGLDRRRPPRRAPGRHPQPAADRPAARLDRRAPLRRRVRRRAPRRGACAGQGADHLAARRVRPLGPPQAAPRAVEPLQRPARPRRARAGVPDLQLDRARRLALHPARGHRAAVDLLRAPARGVPPRRDVAGRGPVGRPARRTRRWRRGRCATAPWATARAPAPSSRTATTLDEVIAEVTASRLTERGATRADDRLSEAAMEDRKREGYF